MNSCFISPLLLFATGCCCFGGVPETLDGFIYHESGRTIARSSYDFARTFSADGSYSTLYSRSTGPNETNGSAGVLQPPINGIYSYRKLDESTAELTLTVGSGSAASSEKRTLRFASESNGTVGFESTTILSAGFGLARLTDRSSLVNCSNRSFASDVTPAFTGFVITGDLARTVIVRAVGPGLASFGITDFLRNPTLSVVRPSTNTIVGANDDWSSENAESVRRTSAAVGAFPLPTASKDAVIILNASPGAYVAQVTSPETGDRGQALIEVYILP